MKFKMKFKHVTATIFITLFIFSIAFFSGSVKSRLPWRTKSTEEIQREKRSPAAPHSVRRKAFHRHGNNFDILHKEEVLKEFDGHSIKIVSNPNFCSHPDIEVVILVISRPTSFNRRKGIRTTYGDSRLFPTLRVFFVIGPHADADMTPQIRREHDVFGDIVLTDRPHDVYRNTSFKVLAGFYYIDKYCKSASYVVKTDEDVLINSFNLLDYLKTRDKVPNNGYFNSPDDYQARGAVFCRKNHYAPVRDVNSPWFVTEEDFPHEMYPPACHGEGVIFDRNVIPTLYGGSYYVKHLTIEDIYFAGMVRKAFFIPIEFVNEIYGGEYLETGVFFHGITDNMMMQEKWNWITVFEEEITFKDGKRMLPLTIDQRDIEYNVNSTENIV